MLLPIPYLLPVTTIPGISSRENRSRLLLTVFSSLPPPTLSLHHLPFFIQHPEKQSSIRRFFPGWDRFTIVNTGNCPFSMEVLSGLLMPLPGTMAIIVIIWVVIRILWTTTQIPTGGTIFFPTDVILKR